MFCETVVYTRLDEERGITPYIIVDGQQRLTTIYLLLKALLVCARTDKQGEGIADHYCIRYIPRQFNNRRNTTELWL
ncbi:MAG: DUF262 domain-containing protein [Lachnospiraceae bacterium]|nr:DUF262 domain-containing protein [Lachnospiraceae bacterium]